MGPNPGLGPNPGYEISRRFGSKTEFVTKFLDDSAWFCVEKLKEHGFETKEPKNMQKIKPKNQN